MASRKGHHYGTGDDRPRASGRQHESAARPRQPNEQFPRQALSNRGILHGQKLRRERFGERRNRVVLLKGRPIRQA